MIRNHPSQLTIHAFDDYFGYRALIDEVNISVLPELSHELSYSGIQLQNVTIPPGRRRQRRRCRGDTSGRGMLLFALRPELAADATPGDTPLALLPYTPPTSQHFWSPAYGLLPRWHHLHHEPPAAKPPELTRLTPILYGNHSEFDELATALTALLTA